MEDTRYQRVQSHPRFRELVESRGRLATILSIVMLAIYFGFILIVAFAPGILAIRLGDSVITLGIPLGIFVIVSAFVLTAIYVAKANTTFDRLNEELLREVR